MAVRPFSIRLRQAQDASASVVELRGDLDGPVCETLEARLNLAMDEGCRFLVIDLTRVELVGVEAWTVLLDLAARIRTHGGDLVVAGLRPDVREAFDLLALEPLLHAFPTAREARLSLTPA